MARRSGRRWMQAAFGKHPGALHHALGIPEDEKIPISLLLEVYKHPERFKQGHVEQRKLRKRAQLALTAHKIYLKHKRKQQRV